MKKLTGLLLGAAIAGLAATAAFAADTIKIAYIDPLSGPFAATGQQGLAQYKFAADELVNKNGGVLGKEFEIVEFDNKISPKESLIQLQVAIDQGIRFIVQGNSSGVANALTEAIEKHNKRNPDDRVLFLNYSAVDPALTNEKCNFWHFRFDANADIKMDALTDIIAANDNIKKVYLIGQDYSFGKAVAAAAVKMLGEKRPDIEIVGNELHPIGKVKDFTPYARKIMASEADAMITGNWGADMVGLGKAVIAAGYENPIYTYYAAADGITATFGEDGKGKVKLVAEGQLNPPPSDRASAYVAAFKEKYPDTDIGQARIANVIEMLAKAIDQAGSDTDIVAIGKALVYMRPQDHQAIQNVHILAHTDEGVTHDFDNSGYGLVVESTVEMASADAPTTCNMERPE
jgi:branched-chain amino acid transport system substrate-binding protein